MAHYQQYFVSILVRPYFSAQLFIICRSIMLHLSLLTSHLMSIPDAPLQQYFKYIKLPIKEAPTLTQNRAIHQQDRKT